MNWQSGFSISGGDFEEQIDRLLLHWEKLDVAKMERIKAHIPAEYSPVHAKLKRGFRSHWKDEWPVPSDARLTEARNFLSGLKMLRLFQKVVVHSGKKYNLGAADTLFERPGRAEAFYEDIAGMFEALYFLEPETAAEVFRGALVRGPHKALATVAKSMRQGILRRYLADAVPGQEDTDDSDTLRTSWVVPLFLFHLYFEMGEDRFADFTDTLDYRTRKSITLLNNLTAEHHMRNITWGKMSGREREYRRMCGIVAFPEHWDESWPVPGREELAEAQVLVRKILDEGLYKNVRSYGGHVIPVAGAEQRSLSDLLRGNPSGEVLAGRILAMYYVDPGATADIIRGAVFSSGPHALLAEMPNYMRAGIFTDIMGRVLGGARTLPREDRLSVRSMIRWKGLFDDIFSVKETGWVFEHAGNDLILDILHLYSLGETIPSHVRDGIARAIGKERLAEIADEIPDSLKELKQLAVSPSHWRLEWGVLREGLAQDMQHFLGLRDEKDAPVDLVRQGDSEMLSMLMMRSELAFIGFSVVEVIEGLKGLFYLAPERTGSMLRAVALPEDLDKLRKTFEHMDLSLVKALLLQSVKGFSDLPAGNAERIRYLKRALAGPAAILALLPKDTQRELFPELPDESVSNADQLKDYFISEIHGLDLAEAIPGHWDASWPVPDDSAVQDADTFLQQLSELPESSDPVQIDGQMYDQAGCSLLFQYFLQMNREGRYETGGPRFLEALYYKDPEKLGGPFAGRRVYRAA